MYLIEKYEEKYNEKINDFIISILVEEFGFEEYREGLIKENNNEYNQNGRNLWIALNENDEIIGTIALVHHNEEVVELKKLYVRKDHRCMGLATCLYNKALEVCKKNGNKKIIIGTYNNLEKAMHFYLKRRI